MRDESKPAYLEQLTARLSERTRKIAVGRSQIRLEFYSRPKFGDRFRQLAPGKQNPSQQVVGIRMSWGQTYGFSEVSFGCF